MSGPYDKLLDKSRELLAVMSADPDEVQLSLKLSEMITRLSKSAKHLETMLAGSKRNKRYGPRVRLVEWRDSVTQLKAIYNEVLAELGGCPAEALEQFNEAMDQLHKDLDCEHNKDSEKIRESLKLMRNEILTSIRQGLELCEVGDAKNLVRLLKTLSSRNRLAINEAVRAGDMPQVGTISAAMDAGIKHAIAPLREWLTESPRRQFNYEHAMFRRGLFKNAHKQLKHLAERLYFAEYYRPLMDDWRERRIANGEERADVFPSSRGGRTDILGARDVTEKQLRKKTKPKKIQHKVPRPTPLTFEAWAKEELNFEVEE